MRDGAARAHDRDTRPYVGIFMSRQGLGRDRVIGVTTKSLLPLRRDCGTYCGKVGLVR